MIEHEVAEHMSKLSHAIFYKAFEIETWPWRVDRGSPRPVACVVAAWETGSLCRSFWVDDQGDHGRRLLNSKAKLVIFSR
jgi:hypothetical protein